MIEISKREFDILNEKKLIKNTREEKNYYVANKNKRKGYKTYYIIESAKVMKVLKMNIINN